MLAVRGPKKKKGAAGGADALPKDAGHLMQGCCDAGQTSSSNFSGPVLFCSSSTPTAKSDLPLFRLFQGTALKLLLDDQFLHIILSKGSAPSNAVSPFDRVDVAVENPDSTAPNSPPLEL